VTATRDQHQHAQHANVTNRFLSCSFLSLLAALFPDRTGLDIAQIEPGTLVVGGVHPEFGLKTAAASSNRFMRQRQIP